MCPYYGKPPWSKCVVKYSVYTLNYVAWIRYFLRRVVVRQFKSCSRVNMVNNLQPMGFTIVKTRRKQNRNY
ncbi:unnamed protein product [Rhizophagus irregularis]|nr:unnamed protein product [Rhizophagus irregularis]